MVKDNISELELIRKAALDYIEGWYEGNEERMERCLYSGLVKRRIVDDKDPRSSCVEEIFAQQLIERTKEGIGRGNPDDLKKISINIYDVFDNMANVKIISAHFIDYLHLGKIDNTWLILNIIWQTR